MFLDEKKIGEVTSPFKSATALGISEVEQTTLIRLLGMLENGEIPEEKFRMDEVSCGSAMCLCGWAYTISEGKAFSFVKSIIEKDYSQTLSRIMSKLPANLTNLFMFNQVPVCIRSMNINQIKATKALRSYLTVGEANWDEVKP